MTPEQTFKLTRQLIDIESITGNEGAVGNFLFDELARLGYEPKKMPMPNAETRFNIYATARRVSSPQVIFSTHIDTVPPFIKSSEDETNIYGRGACDTKGIIAAMLNAAERLRDENANVPIGLLFVVGEERDSLGARVANDSPLNPKAKYLINGEPTENQVAIASKGALRVEITATGKMAHSAYPHLGESAIEKLLEALNRVRKLTLPVNPEVGPTTMNIGIIEGGRAPNVIPDFAKAQLLYRMVGPAEQLKSEIANAVGDLAKVEAVLDIPFVKLRTFDNLPTFVAAYTTDIPALSKWGEPILFGPGSIHVAHTTGEYIDKKQQLEAAEIYFAMAKKLLALIL
ncbi:MAG: peptidase dimerization [Candidatus Angelobacter sp.]|nr:peptidase dimerization [Candidatus Angelobacter sp.]